jgi:hypothetical protein
VSASDQVRDVATYLSRHGWTPDAPGVAGTLWRAPAGAPNPDGVVGVPTILDLGSVEWNGVLDRIAFVEDSSPLIVGLAIQRQYVDVANMRAANDVLITGSIPLTSGITLMRSAFAMVRASAATSQRPRPHINGGWTERGEEIAAGARMAHTLEGSYVIPILMPLSTMEEPTAATADIPFAELATDRLPREPAERRAMRTLAEALTAVSRLVVEPAQDPAAAVVPALVSAGVSLELVDALRAVVTDPAVSEFEATFSWAGALPAPRSAPPSIAIPQEAAELLEAVSNRMRTARIEPSQIITGPIVEWHQIPNEPRGWIGVQTVRQKQERIVRVMLDANAVTRALDYAKASRTVVVDGRVTGGRGRSLQVLDPTRFLALDETFIAPHGEALAQGSEELRVAAAQEPIRLRQLTPPRTGFEIFSSPRGYLVRLRGADGSIVATSGPFRTRDEAQAGSEAIARAAASDSLSGQ